MASTSALPVQPALPPCVSRVAGPGGLPMVSVRDAEHGELDVALQGAHVTRWSPPGGGDVLWLSPTAVFGPGTAIRGGVPICFPWFGGGPDGADRPSHGYARLMPWRLASATRSASGVELVLGLDPVAPSALAASYRITVGAALGLELSVHNTGACDASFEAALHTYLAVSDVRRVAVTGLGGVSYLDRLGGPEPVPQEDDVLRLTGETDRIYQGTDAAVVVHDVAAGRRLEVVKAGSASTVVWNPWSGTGGAMSDVGPAWTSMLCVETANVREHAVTLAPDGVHTMTSTIGVHAGTSTSPR